jgi:Transposase DDE domain group 1
VCPVRQETAVVGRLLSVGGIWLSARIEKRLGLADLLASCVTDERDRAGATHSYADMIRARMLAIARGYEDWDDLDAPRSGPAFDLAGGRLSETGNDLMSQPILSRLEYAPSCRELARMGLSLIDLF